MRININRTIKTVGLIFVFVITLSIDGFSQWMLIDENGGKPDASAALEVSDTSRGFLPPRLTTTQMNAISSPASGLLIFNTSDSTYKYYDGDSWESVGSDSNLGGASGSGELSYQYITRRTTGFTNSGLLLKATDLAFEGDSLIQVNNTGASSLFIALKKCIVNASHSIRFSGANQQAIIFKNSLSHYGNGASTSSYTATASHSFALEAGDTLEFGGSGAINTSFPWFLNIVAISIDGSNENSTTTISSVDESGIVLIKDVKSSGTNGGTSATTWTKRDLNTLSGDTSFVSISNNEFTLNQGIYSIEWSAPAYLSDEHQSRLYDVTNSSVVNYGSTEFNNDLSNVTTQSKGNTILEITSTQTLRIEHIVKIGKVSSGFGVAGNFTNNNIYTQVKITKLDKVFGSGGSGSSNSTDTLDENIFSAFIQNNGTASITSQSRDFISSVTRNSLGVVTINFKTSFFTQAPSMVATVNTNSDYFAHINPVTTASATVRVKTNLGVAIDRNFWITVQRQGSDYRYNTSGASSSALQSTSSTEDSTRITNAAGNTKIEIDVSNNTIFSNGGSESARFNSSGFLGLNNNNPQSLLDVAGTAIIDSLRIYNAYSLPGYDGTANQVLQTNGSGEVTWETLASGADNLGNHSATQIFQLNGFKISNDGGNEGIGVANNGQVTISPATSGAGNLAVLANGDYRTAGQGTGYYMTNTAIGITGNNSNQGDMRFKTNNADRIRILSGGQVGIGTTSPNSKLDVNGATTVRGNLQMDGNSRSLINNSSQTNRRILQLDADTGGGSTFMIYGNEDNQYPGALRFVTNNQWTTPKMVIDSSGKMGIGASAPDSTLTVDGGIKTTYFTMTDGTALNGKVLTSDANGVASWQSAPTSPWTVSGSDVYRSAGEVGIGIVSPGAKLHVFENQVGSTRIRVENVNAGGHAYFEAGGDATLSRLYSHGSTRTIQRYGFALGGWTELQSSSTMGTVIGNDNNVPIRLAVNNETQVNITSSSVGIGTLTNTSDLHIMDSTGAANFRLENATGGDHDVRMTFAEDGNSRYHIGYDDGLDALVFSGSGWTANRRMRLTSDGKLSIGTITPDSLLTVNGGIRAENIRLSNGAGTGKVLVSDNLGNASWGSSSILSDQDADTYIEVDDGADADNIRFYTNGGKRLTIGSNGGVGVNTEVPFGRFHVVDSSGVMNIKFQTLDASAVNLYLENSTANSRISNLSNGDLLMVNNGYRNFEMDSAGQIMLGGDGVNPIAPVTIYGGRKDNLAFEIDNNASNQGIAWQNTGGNYTWNLYRDANSDFVIAGGSDANIDNLTNYLHIDQTSGNVGLGTSTPTTNLQVVGTAPTNATSGQLQIDESGGNSLMLGRTTTYGYAQTQNSEPFVLNPISNNVGIGTTTPQAKFHVSGGDMLLDNTEELQGENSSGTAVNLIKITGANHVQVGESSIADIKFNAGSANNAMTVKSGGNVGIGTTTPTDLLEVDGGIDADSINVAELNSPTTGSLNLLPVAMGRISSSGVISTGSGNFTVSKGTAGRYTITVTGVTLTNNSTMVMVAPESSINGKTLTYDIVSGKLELYMFIADTNTLTNNAFSFMIYTN